MVAARKAPEMSSDSDKRMMSCLLETRESNDKEIEKGEETGEERAKKRGGLYMTERAL